MILNLTRELGVNLAGIEIILNMRDKMGEMQSQMEEFIKFVAQEVRGTWALRMSAGRETRSCAPFRATLFAWKSERAERRRH